MKAGQTRKGFNSECEEMPPFKCSQQGSQKGILLGERIRTLPLGGPGGIFSQRVWDGGP